jgi:ABC-2 type transport system ATP-binding protein
MIEVEKLRKVYPGDVEAVVGIDFEVAPGEVFALLGPNGAGKSTTIGMLTTTVRPTGGTARLAGFDVRTQQLAARKVSSVVFQDAVVDRSLTGRRNLELHGRLWGVEPAQAERRIEELVDAVGLRDLVDRPVGTYSGGERRRMEIARALVSSPRVLFLDEPTTGLDPQSRRAIWDMFGELKAHDPDLAIILTTHAMEEADHLCTRVAILDQGRILCEDSPEALKRGLATGERVELETDRAITPADRQGIVEEGATNVRYASPTRVTFDAKPGEATGRRVARLLEIEGYHIVHLSIALVTLEDVFFSYTGRALREAPPAP